MRYIKLEITNSQIRWNRSWLASRNHVPKPSSMREAKQGRTSFVPMGFSAINRLAVMRGSGERYSDGIVRVASTLTRQRRDLAHGFGQFLGLGDRYQDNDPVDLH